MDETFLNQITTRWPLISDPLQFVMRYAPAIRRYMAALIKNPDDLEDALQDFLLKVVERGFGSEQNIRGRFRDYLKAAVRNAALTHLRKKPATQASDLVLAGLADDADDTGDSEWVAEWRGTLLEQALEKLDDHERHAPDSRMATVLSLARDNPAADSMALAALAEKKTGRPMTPEAFRKQLSRARSLLANILVDEIRRTLEDPTQEQIDAELAELGLRSLVEPYLT